MKLGVVSCRSSVSTNSVSCSISFRDIAPQSSAQLVGGCINYILCIINTVNLLFLNSGNKSQSVQSTKFQFQNHTPTFGLYPSLLFSPASLSVLWSEITYTQHFLTPLLSSLLPISLPSVHLVQLQLLSSPSCIPSPTFSPLISSS